MLVDVSRTIDVRLAGKVAVENRAPLQHQFDGSEDTVALVLTPNAKRKESIEISPTYVGIRSL